MRTRVSNRALTWTFIPLFLVGCHADDEAKARRPAESAAPKRAPEAPEPVLAGNLTFLSPDGDKVVVALEDLRKDFALQEVESEDPNYGARKTFFVIPLQPILEKFLQPLAGSRLSLKATDGYSVEIEADRLLSPDVYLAVGDRAPGRFEPIGERKADAGPSYIVWKGDEYSDDKKYPRPWGLSTIEKLDSADHHQHTRPDDGFGENEAALKGYEIFSASCIRCHAINREGGKLGPDLNVPQNILSYRPEEQVRAYIRDPETFRYSSMPAHPDFSDADIDHLIAYLSLMGEHQHDPDAN